MNELQELLRKLNKEQYTQLCPTIGASIGAHVRHIIEAYNSVINGAMFSEVRYDVKERDYFLQEELSYALMHLRRVEAIGGRLEKCNIVKVGEYPSTVGRELDYCDDHLVHHCAMIRSVLRCIELEHLVGPNFGFAKGTIKNRENKTT